MGHLLSFCFRPGNPPPQQAFGAPIVSANLPSGAAKISTAICGKERGDEKRRQRLRLRGDLKHRSATGIEPLTARTTEITAGSGYSEEMARLVAEDIAVWTGSILALAEGV